VTALVELSPTLRILEAANYCDAGVDIVCLETLESTVGRTLSSLAIIISRQFDHVQAFVCVARMANLERLRLDLNFHPAALDDYDYDVPALILPRLQYFRLDFMRHPKLITWLGSARFRKDCELHLICSWSLLEEDTDALNPLFEAHASRCVYVTDACFGERSAILRHCTRVDFGLGTHVSPALFAAPSLPRDIRLFLRGRPGKDRVYLAHMRQAIVNSGHTHAGTRMYIRTSYGFSWRDREPLRTNIAAQIFAEDWHHLSGVLAPCGISIFDEAGYTPFDGFPADLWPKHEDGEDQYDACDPYSDDSMDS
jgi:hypothetical protein